MTRGCEILEVPLPSVLDDADVDRLLARLRQVHGAPRFDFVFHREAKGFTDQRKDIQ
jgi:hypothetical protein